MIRIHRQTIQKGLNDPDNHNGVLTNLELDILDCEVKWALGSVTTNTASRGGRIPAELLKLLKDDAVEVLHSIYPTNLKNSAVATGLEKVSFHFNLKEQCQRMFQLPLHSFHMLAR